MARIPHSTSGFLPYDFLNNIFISIASFVVKSIAYNTYNIQNTYESTMLSLRLLVNSMLLVNLDESKVTCKFSIEWVGAPNSHVVQGSTVL